MGRVKQLFVCSGCGRPSAQWSGKCASCGEWGTVSEHPVGAGGRERSRATAAPMLDLASDSEECRIGTGFPGVDRVLGGGLVPGSVVLLAGAPGIGKSTLLLQLASRLTAAGRPCLLASGEEARGQVAERARRLGIVGSALSFCAGRDLDEVVAAALSEQPEVLVVDSIHTIRSQSSDSLPGGPGQVRLCVDALTGLAKEQGVTTLLIGHVTKSGDLAGPRTIEHAVDVVLTFEGEPRSGLRVLAGGKNRFGPEGEVAWFDMGAAGLREREPSVRLGGEAGEPGCATAVVLAGRRALAVEVQALVVPSEGPPRRQVSGLDSRRFHILAAVADRVARLGLVRAELYGSVAGGLRLDDPAADLAVFCALASASCGTAPPADMAFAGEVSLAGSVRPVGSLEQRAAAAAAAGVGRLVCARGEPGPSRLPDGLRLCSVGHAREALHLAIGSSGLREPRRTA